MREDCNKVIKDIEYAKDLLQNRPERDTVDYKVYEVLDDALDLIHDLRSQIAMLVGAQHELCEMMKEQGCAKIKEPDCRICSQSHCKYYHESRKPTECKSYVRVDLNPSQYEIKKADKTDLYNLKELWKRARDGETLNETELNFLLADWDERNIFKPQEEGR